MKFQFLGVGGAFARENFHSNMVLSLNGKRLLIDAGGDIRFSLAAAGLKLTDLHAVYVSHLHGDHVGGMEYLALGTKFNPAFVDDAGAKRKLKLFIKSNMARDLWNNVMRGGTATIQGEVNTLDTFFDVKKCGHNGKFTFEGTNFLLVQTVHYVNDRELAPSYGLFWQAPNGQKVFLTTDTQFAPASIVTFYKQADIVFHDCEIGPFKSGVHAHFTDLCTLPVELRAKMWLYHYNDGDKLDAVEHGFAGWVKQGQEFDFS
ncbi:MAG: MBL fold metallo-hydrolase [Candidatus Obscuribacterales bacterium]|nr:MBL fold metallo-hydrolase [Candidatus Obscuribacterales bacterium]